jgi:hypothetical protein
VLRTCRTWLSRRTKCHAANEPGLKWGQMLRKGICSLWGYPVDPWEMLVCRSSAPPAPHSTGIGSYTFESYYRSYKVATPCVNRCDSWIYHIRLSRKKFQKKTSEFDIDSVLILSDAQHSILLLKGYRTALNKVTCCLAAGSSSMSTNNEYL